MIKTRIGNKNDIDGVLALQEKYLYRNLSEIERKEGFVTTPFTVSQIEEIILQNGLILAVNENDVTIAYAFAGSWKYFEQWELFKHMISRFPKMSFNGNKITTENSFQYGPFVLTKNIEERAF